MTKAKYSDLLAKWLLDAGYEKCFSLGGGNIMHLVESVSNVMPIVPVVHEVAAGVATEYFNEVSTDKRAFALVTTGPGLTNIVTALAGAHLESRELLVIGGQVKTSDLCHGELRQRGIQEVQGAKLVETITKLSVRLDHPIKRSAFLEIVKTGWAARKGPVFIEMPLDVQARSVDVEAFEDGNADLHLTSPLAVIDASALQQIVERLRQAKRPVLLLGSGVDRVTAQTIGPDGFVKLGIPVMTSWNASDRMGCDHPLYFGRPNTWGQRYSNILIQQSDCVIAIGARLGLQQSGFNWQEFVPCGDIIQIDIDPQELNKGHPNVFQGHAVDANDFLLRLSRHDLGEPREWIEFCQAVKAKLPLIEENINVTGEGYLSPYVFFDRLSHLLSANDIVIPCSSGGAFTCAYQSILQKFGQIVVSDKSLASMGYGLSGAIGAAFAYPDRRTVLIEGDGGFAQNLQEVGTAAINQQNLKMFIFDDKGYASIRMTQRSYFGGRYVGCDTTTGLGLPNWSKIFDAYDVPCVIVRPGFEQDPDFLDAFNSAGVTAFLVQVDPEQTYFPKISSRVRPDGGMESNPLHLMTPPLSDELYAEVAKYL